MVRIRFTQLGGGGDSCYKVHADDLKAFKESALDPTTTTSLKTWNGTIHNFPPGTIREFSERPYDPNHHTRRSR